MNTSILTNPIFKLNFDRAWEELKKEQKFYSDIKIWWDVAKRRIKNIAMHVSNKIRMEQTEREREIERRLTILKDLKNDSDEVNSLKIELKDIHEKWGMGSKVRSRARWWEDGERSTKYFHSLEKKNGKEKSWSKIIDEDGSILYGTKAVQRRQVKFYKSLYSSEFCYGNQEGDKEFLGCIENRLNESQNTDMNSDLSIDEITAAVKSMNNNKSPGPDGIPTEFYKLYWTYLKSDLIKIYTKGLDDKELAYSQYLAVITLLYKKGTREEIKNWRPISLLNTDYKILSKALANRIKCVLPTIIHEDQRGCVPGRHIGEIIRNTEDILFELEKGNSDSVILMLDMEKAFDRVEWNWLLKVLKGFNFGNRFISWLETLYKHAKCSIMTNGVQSEYFSISRGIRQRDALSALLYIIQSEQFA